MKEKEYVFRNKWKEIQNLKILAKELEIIRKITFFMTF
jgi:hypothetical protein